jgi:hypothetical protein
LPELVSKWLTTVIATAGYPWIGYECCKGTTWALFKLVRENIPLLGAMSPK